MSGFPQTGPVAGEGRGNVAADGAPPPMKGREALFAALRRIFCRHFYVDYYGRFDDEFVCLDCGKRKVFRDA